MSMSCLTCNVVSQGGKSDLDREPYSSPRTARCCGIKRSLSDELSPSPYLQLRTGSTEPARYSRTRKGNKHRKIERVDSPTSRDADGGEPRLMRSGGVRRDWSFEDLRNRNAVAKRM